MDGQKCFCAEDIVTLKQFENIKGMRKKNNLFYCERINAGGQEKRKK
jgi:hypothetical protein